MEANGIGMEMLRDRAGLALNSLKAAGADSAQCVIEVRDCDEVQAEANRFDLMRSFSVVKLSLSAIKDGRVGNVNVNRMDDASLEEAVRRCMKASDSAAFDEFARFAPKIENRDFTRGMQDGNINALTRRLVEFGRDVKREYKEIMMDCGGMYTREKSVLMNTNGVEFTDECGYYNASASFTAVRNNTTTSFGPGVYYITLDPDERIMEREGVRREIETALSLFSPKPVGEKFTGTLVATPGFTSEFFELINGIALNDASVTSGTSKLCNRLGERVADEKLTLSFAPRSKEIVMGERFDKDGYETGDCTPIEGGILKSYLLTAHGALMSGLPRGANTGTAMIVEPSETPLEELIKNVERGILIGRYSGTEPDVSGELSGVAKNSFYIENGKIVCPVIETMISANMFDMMNNIRMISKEARRTGYSVAPYIAFDGVVIK